MAKITNSKLDELEKRSKVPTNFPLLATYVPDLIHDLKEARRIINGIGKALTDAIEIVE